MTNRALLFDFDGVLIQSIEDHHRSWNAVFTDFGVSIGWDEFASLEGQSLFWISERLCLNHGIAREHAEVIALRKNDIYKKTAQIRFYPGALELLDELKTIFRLALVTGAHRDRFDHSVDVIFKSKFQTIVTADDVTTKKPSPEPYVKAAKNIDVPVEDCIVVENAPFGIESARRAGMRCIALRTTLSDTFLSDADWIVDDITQIRSLVVGTP